MARPAAEAVHSSRSRPTETVLRWGPIAPALQPLHGLRGRGRSIIPPATKKTPAGEGGRWPRNQILPEGSEFLGELDVQEASRGIVQEAGITGGVGTESGR